MKKCPYCAEEIQDDAIKCRYCNEFLNKGPQEKWYFKISTVVMALLCVGPFGLPLVWFNPRFSLKSKLIITIAVCVLAYLLAIWVNASLKYLRDYYKQAF